MISFYDIKDQQVIYNNETSWVIVHMTPAPDYFDGKNHYSGYVYFIGKPIQTINYPQNTYADLRWVRYDEIKMI